METTRSRIPWVGLTLASLLALLTTAFVPSAAVAQTLGNALDFAVLSMSGDVIVGNTSNIDAAGSFTPLGDVGGQNVSLGNNLLAGGDAIADPGIIALGNFSKVRGMCITDVGVIIPGIGAKCVSGVDTSGTNGKLTVMADAITDVGAFVTALPSPTDSLPPLSVLSGVHSIVDTVTFPPITTLSRYRRLSSGQERFCTLLVWATRGKR